MLDRIAAWQAALAAVLLLGTPALAEDDYCVEDFAMVMPEEAGDAATQEWLLQELDAMLEARCFERDEDAEANPFRAYRVAQAAADNETADSRDGAYRYTESYDGTQVCVSDEDGGLIGCHSRDEAAAVPEPAENPFRDMSDMELAQQMIAAQRAMIEQLDVQVGLRDADIQGLRHRIAALDTMIAALDEQIEELQAPYENVVCNERFMTITIEDPEAQWDIQRAVLRKSDVRSVVGPRAANQYAKVVLSSDLAPVYTYSQDIPAIMACLD